MARAPGPQPTHRQDSPVRPPADIPKDIFEAALGTYLDCRRLDMRGLAAELAMSRATLYRKVAGRDHLLGQILWYLAQHAFVRALAAGAGRRGARRVLAVNEHFMREVHEQPALHRLLDSEPEAALRVLTSKHGFVQRGIIERLRLLLEEEVDNGALRVSLDTATLAYVIVRIGESFLYADVIADNEPDVDGAVEVVARLLGVD